MGIVARMKDTTAKARDVRRTGGERVLRRGGSGKTVHAVSPERPQRLRYQRRPVDDCSPGRGGMVQDGGTRGETFHSEVDPRRESQGWTTACSSMPERDGKDQGKDGPKQACSCWFVRHSWLATSGANVYPPGVLLRLPMPFALLWRFWFVIVF